MSFLDESSDNSNMIVRLGGVLLLGAILLSGFVQGVLSTESRSITLHMTQNPSDGETFTLDNHVFEFDSGDSVQSGNIPVVITSTLDGTSENLRNAITSAGYGVESHAEMD